MGSSPPPQDPKKPNPYIWNHNQLTLTINPHTSSRRRYSSEDEGSGHSSHDDHVKHHQQTKRKFGLKQSLKHSSKEQEQSHDRKAVLLVLLFLLGASLAFFQYTHVTSLHTITGGPNSWTVNTGKKAKDLVATQVRRNLTDLSGMLQEVLRDVEGDVSEWGHLVGVPNDCFSFSGVADRKEKKDGNEKGGDGKADGSKDIEMAVYTQTMLSHLRSLDQGILRLATSFTGSGQSQGYMSEDNEEKERQDRERFQNQGIRQDQETRQEEQPSDTEHHLATLRFPCHILVYQVSAIHWQYKVLLDGLIASPEQKGEGSWLWSLFSCIDYERGWQCGGIARVHEELALQALNKTLEWAGRELRKVCLGLDEVAWAWRYWV